MLTCYSQGAAIAHRSIESLPDQAKSRILGVITYGDTQTTQDKAQIPNFPKDKLKIICNDGGESRSAACCRRAFADGMSR